MCCCIVNGNAWLGPVELDVPEGCAGGPVAYRPAGEGARLGQRDKARGSFAEAEDVATAYGADGPSIARVVYGRISHSSRDIFNLEAADVHLPADFESLLKL